MYRIVRQKGTRRTQQQIFLDVPPDNHHHPGSANEQHAHTTPLAQTRQCHDDGSAANLIAIGGWSSRRHDSKGSHSYFMDRSTFHES